MNIMITIFFIVVVFCVAYRVGKLEHRILALEKTTKNNAATNDKADDTTIISNEKCKETEALK